MPKPEISQSQKRFQESLGALFSIEAQKSDHSCLFLKSSSDQGVIRNGGRNGARFAPQSFLSTFKKFSQTQELKKYHFVELEVSDEDRERSDFHLSQAEETTKILRAIEKHQNAFLCHIGGGHDHIFPLLSALGKKFDEIIVINIDAHADTRTDLNFHSGTPFRQFANNYVGKFHLFQIGLHSFANTESTLSPLEKGKETILWSHELSAENLKNLFKTIEKEVSPKTAVVFSLDCDALSGATVPGVSAVNPSGVTQAELKIIWDFYRALPLSHSPILGIYELNPLYDTLASLSMRTIGSFVFNCLNNR